MINTLTLSHTLTNHTFMLIETDFWIMDDALTQEILTFSCYNWTMNSVKCQKLFLWKKNMIDDIKIKYVHKIHLNQNIKATIWKSNAKFKWNLAYNKFIAFKKKKQNCNKNKLIIWFEKKTWLRLLKQNIHLYINKSAYAIVFVMKLNLSLR